MDTMDDTIDGIRMGDATRRKINELDDILAQIGFGEGKLTNIFIERTTERATVSVLECIRWLNALKDKQINKKFDQDKFNTVMKGLCEIGLPWANEDMQTASEALLLARTRQDSLLSESRKYGVTA